MSASEIKTARTLGQWGYASRGLVFVMVGLITLITVLQTSSGQAQGFDAALATMAHTPYGEILLGLVAIGLVLFGIYSLMCAKWTRIGTPRPA